MAAAFLEADAGVFNTDAETGIRGAYDHRNASATGLCRDVEAGRGIETGHDAPDRVAPVGKFSLAQRKPLTQRWPRSPASACASLRWSQALARYSSAPPTQLALQPRFEPRANVGFGQRSALSTGLLPASTHCCGRDGAHWGPGSHPDRDWRGFRWCKHRDRRGAEPGDLP